MKKTLIETGKFLSTLATFIKLMTESGKSEKKFQEFISTTDSKELAKYGRFLSKLVVFIRLMTEQYLLEKGFQHVINNVDSRKLLVKFWNRLTTGFPSYEQAREIMGFNFVGVEKVKECFGIDLAPEQYFKYIEIPYSTKTLKKLCRTHILTAVFPISIFEMAKRYPNLFDIKIISTYYNDPKETFMREVGEYRWILLNKQGIKNTQGYDSLIAQPVVYAMLCYFLTSEEMLFTDLYGVHVSNMTYGEGNEVYVNFEDRKIGFSDHEFNKTQDPHSDNLKKRASSVSED